MPGRATGSKSGDAEAGRAGQRGMDHRARPVEPAIEVGTAALHRGDHVGALANGLPCRPLDRCGGARRQVTHQHVGDIGVVELRPGGGDSDERRRIVDLDGQLRVHLRRRLLENAADERLPVDTVHVGIFGRRDTDAGIERSLRIGL